MGRRRLQFSAVVRCFSAVVRCFSAVVRCFLAVVRCFFGCGSVFFGCGSVFFGCGLVVVWWWFGVFRLWCGCGSVVVCLISVAKPHRKSKEARQNRAFFVEATHQELKQAREQGDFERVRRF